VTGDSQVRLQSQKALIASRFQPEDELGVLVRIFPKQRNR